MMQQAAHTYVDDMISSDSESDSCGEGCMDLTIHLSFNKPIYLAGALSVAKSAAYSDTAEGRSSCIHPGASSCAEFGPRQAVLFMTPEERMAGLAVNGPCTPEYSKAVQYRRCPASTHSPLAHEGSTFLRAAAPTSTASEMAAPEIEMVWPVCMPLRCGGGSHCWIDVRLAQPAVEPFDVELVQVRATDQGMNLLASSPVTSGREARCCLPTRGLLLNDSLCGTLASVIDSTAKVAARPPMRMLSLFADSGLAAGSGAAVAVLCAPPDVAIELQTLFLQLAWKLLTLDQDRRLPHLQMMDVHGFVVLPGAGSTAASTAARTHRHIFSSAKAGPSAAASRSGVRDLPRSVRKPYSRVASIDLSSGRLAPQLALSGPPWAAGAAEARACSVAWSDYFQPLMREISYLLTCVPGAVPLSRWDHRMYCKTLVGLVAFLEHHGCWSTLADLLSHAGGFHVALCHRGERVGKPGATATASEIESLLTSARHEEVGVQYLPPPDSVRSGCGQLPSASVAARPGPSCWPLEEESAAALQSGPSGYVRAYFIQRESMELLFSSLDQLGSFGDFHCEEELAAQFESWRDDWLVPSGCRNDLAAAADVPPATAGSTPSSSPPPEKLAMSRLSVTSSDDGDGVSSATALLSLPSRPTSEIGTLPPAAGLCMRCRMLLDATEFKAACVDGPACGRLFLSPWISDGMYAFWENVVLSLLAGALLLACYACFS